jgi:hypothetical protein
MTIDDIRRAKNQRPFQAYRLIMADGREIQINHPDAVSWESDRSRTIFAISQGEHHWIDIRQVTQLALPVTRATESNGE